MAFVRLETSDRDTRWINLDQLSRVTLGTDRDDVEFIVAVFADGHLEDRLEIRGTDDTNVEAIRRLQRALNHKCETE